MTSVPNFTAILCLSPHPYHLTSYVALRALAQTYQQFYRVIVSHDNRMPTDNRSPRKISDNETWSMEPEVLHFRSVGRDVARSQQRRQAVEPLAFVDVFAAWPRDYHTAAPLRYRTFLIIGAVSGATSVLWNGCSDGIPRMAAILVLTEMLV